MHQINRIPSVRKGSLCQAAFFRTFFRSEQFLQDLPGPVLPVIIFFRGIPQGMMKRVRILDDLIKPVPLDMLVAVVPYAGIDHCLFFVRAPVQFVNHMDFRVIRAFMGMVIRILGLSA